MGGRPPEGAADELGPSAGLPAGGGLPGLAALVAAVVLAAGRLTCGMPVDAGLGGVLSAPPEAGLELPEAGPEPWLDDEALAAEAALAAGVGDGVVGEELVAGVWPLCGVPDGA
jgi:hypothetical protein